MKKKTVVLSSLVLLAVLGSSLALPAMASADTMQCNTPMSTVQSLSDCVQMCYSMGFITSQGLETTLLSQVAAAQTELSQGQTAAAIATLQAFINTVNANSGIFIAPDHAACIVMHAQAVIQGLGG